MSFLHEFITRNQTFGEILKAEYMCIKRKSLNVDMYACFVC